MHAQLKLLIVLVMISYHRLFINSSTLLQYKNDAGSNCRERNNTDKVVNIFGRKLIDMCKSTGLLKN